MVTRAENELMTRVEGDAPLGRLMRENYWVPFALSENLVAGDAPTPVRLFGENYVALRTDDGRIGFFDELCPHRRASLAAGPCRGQRAALHLPRLEGRRRRAASSRRRRRCCGMTQFCAAVPVVHFPVHEEGGIAWVWLGGGDDAAVSGPAVQRRVRPRDGA